MFEAIRRRLFRRQDDPPGPEAPGLFAIAKAITSGTTADAERAGARAARAAIEREEQRHRDERRQASADRVARAVKRQGWFWPGED